MQNPVGWLEIYVSDMQRAKAFYETVLSQPLAEMPSPLPGLTMYAFPMAQGGPGAGGALVSHPMRKPSPDGTLGYFSCADCAVEASRVAAAGGTLVQAKTPIGAFGFIALALDTEGNAIGFHSF
jgi:predicted enzyme related to lactoylglutathione lyase